MKPSEREIAKKLLSRLVLLADDPAFVEAVADLNKFKSVSSVRDDFDEASMLHLLEDFRMVAEQMSRLENIAMLLKQLHVQPDAQVDLVGRPNDSEIIR